MHLSMCSNLIYAHMSAGASVLPLSMCLRNAAAASDGSSLRERLIRQPANGPKAKRRGQPHVRPYAADVSYCTLCSRGRHCESLALHVGAIAQRADAEEVWREVANVRCVCVCATARILTTHQRRLAQSLGPLAIVDACWQFT